MELIVAIDTKNGMGYKNKMPWHCSEELNIFYKKTEGSMILMGYNTAINLPKLPNREILCISHTIPLPVYIQTLPNNITFIKDITYLKMKKNIFVAGGQKTYENNISLVDKIHLSRMKSEYKCDTFFDIKLLKNFVIVEETDYEEFTHYVLVRTKNGEQQYLDLLEKILNDGDSYIGRNGPTKSIFVEHFNFDMRNGFPLLTTKKMFLRGILEEFLFFIRGETNAKLLSDKKVHIWDGNTTSEFIASRNLPYAEGIMGPMYGYQWRNFGAPYQLDGNNYPLKPEGGIDQLENVINLIKTDPNSRRILMTTYNPTQANEGVLYPCHSITIQFYVQDEYLDMFCYNRSQDSFLGVPYNIASSSLLLMTVAKLTNKTPRYLKMTMGDTHIYEDHIEQSQEQISRHTYKLPTLKLPTLNNIKDLENCDTKSFILENYKCHSTIKAKMIV
jgi:thymidylate synthase/dihydrofolate reductase